MNPMSFGNGAHQQWVQVDGARIHTVSQGEGACVVLVAGWPQSLWAWRHVFPKLATRYRVVAVDLPGLGDSTQSSTDYDVVSIASRLRAAIGALGIGRYHLVCHDIGSWIGFPMGMQHPDEIEKLVLMDAVIPGIVPMVPVSVENAYLSWHFGFNAIPELPEALTQGRERQFLSWFFRHRAHVTQAFSEADIDEYERVYRAPGAMTAGFSYYRHMGRSARQIADLSSRKLTMPVLVIGAARGVGARMVDAVLPHCARAHGVVLDQCGHYIPEEAPDRLLPLLETFIG